MTLLLMAAPTVPSHTVVQTHVDASRSAETVASEGQGPLSNVKPYQAASGALIGAGMLYYMVGQAVGSAYMDAMGFCLESDGAAMGVAHWLELSYRNDPEYGTYVRDLEPYTAEALAFHTLFSGPIAIVADTIVAFYGASLSTYETPIRLITRPALTAMFEPVRPLMAFLYALELAMNQYNALLADAVGASPFPPIGPAYPLAMFTAMLDAGLGILVVAHAFGHVDLPMGKLFKLGHKLVDGYLWFGKVVLKNLKGFERWLNEQLSS